MTLYISTRYILLGKSMTVAMDIEYNQPNPLRNILVQADFFTPLCIAFFTQKRTEKQHPEN